MTSRTDISFEIPQMRKPLKIWDKLEIVIGEGKTAGYYLTRVEDFVGGGIVISDPERMKGRAQVMENVMVLVLVQGDDAVYQFRSKMKKFASENSSRYILSPPTSVRRVQRRQFVRIDFVTKVRYCPVREIDGDEFDLEKIAWKETASINLSGGGLCMEIAEGIDLGDALLMQVDVLKRLELPEMIVGVVRRLEYNHGATRGGIEFLLRSTLTKHLGMPEIRRLPREVQDFDDRAQNELINFVFREQIEMRNKGLL